MKKLVFGLLMLVGMLVSAQDVVRVAASHDNGAYIYGPKVGGSGPGSCTNLMAT